MNILFFVGEFPKLSQTFILNQITGLIDAGHDVKILAKKGETGGRLHDDVTRYRLMDRVVYYGMGGSDRRLNKGIDFLIGLCVHTAARFFRKNYIGGRASFRDLIRYPNLILLIRTLNRINLSDREIILAHFGPNGILAQKCIALGLLKGKLFAAFHGYDMLRFVKQKGKNAYGELFRSDCTLLPISRFWAERCIELGARPERILVHHMGIDVKKFEYSPIRPAEQLSIISAARFVEKKGLEYGIQAVGSLIRQGFPVRYSIIGGGPLEDRLRRIIAEQQLSDHVHLLGWKTQDELIRVMKGAQIVLVPSVTAGDGDMEGIPVQLMEAMAMGKIVVSTRHSGIPELIHDRINGFLVEEKDAAGLAKTVREILSSPEKQIEAAEHARLTVVGQFNIERLNARLIRIFEKQLSGI
ncbi:glycosyltransferase [Sporolactobacillus putidus]|uniref:Colanic acid biosynthesis glycosyltransferase WcaL n=1 Tax=Sporolactobacillus putidus TaxID=492735 RepID=A0A917W3B9_9BACL|nr:glycosyltransferase [Sporolactobacillus putidus]GGL58756.1 colanic acid biosynthesis glycosyltransferase WcaL [Sporolactobacillus putidus]